MASFYSSFDNDSMIDQPSMQQRRTQPVERAPSSPRSPHMAAPPMESFEAPTSSVVSLTLLSIFELVFLIGFCFSVFYAVKQRKAAGGQPQWSAHFFALAMFFLGGLIYGAMSLYTESSVLVELRALNGRMNQLQALFR